MTHHATALNLAAIVDHSARLMPDRVALTCAGRSMTYGQLNQQAERVAAALAAHGDRVRRSRRAQLSQPAVVPDRLLRHSQGRGGGRAAQRAAEAARDRLPPEGQRRESPDRVRRDRRTAARGDGEGRLRRSGVPAPPADDARARRAQPCSRRADPHAGHARGGSCAVPDAPAPHGRHRGHPLHLGHHRAPERRRAHPREHAAQRRGQPRHVPAGDSRRHGAGGRARHPAAVPLHGTDLPDERRAARMDSGWC